MKFARHTLLTQTKCLNNAIRAK